ncbi:MAG: hypothetical protein JXA21_02275 [Anaerolineae bacterium]|nr:hypothetical protein [Anaerolineae bacterium]
MTREFESPLQLGIAGTALDVCGPEGWLAPLQRVWIRWRPQSTIPAWPVEIVADETCALPDAPLFETMPRCRGGECELTGNGFLGHISAAGECATLRAHPQATPADVGYFLRVVLAVQGFTRGGLLFHAAGIAHRNRGYALFGVSGSGKSTAARLSAPDPVLNDDLLVLWPDEDAWRIYATPFGMNLGAAGSSIRLHALLRLVKAPRVFLEPLPAGRALGELVANTPVLAGDVSWLPEVFARWEKVMSKIPVRALHFQKEPTFWEVIDAELG